jgi:hypothetical protein
MLDSTLITIVAVSGILLATAFLDLTARIFGK